MTGRRVVLGPGAVLRDTDVEHVTVSGVGVELVNVRIGPAIRPLRWDDWTRPDYPHGRYDEATSLDLYGPGD